MSEERIEKLYQSRFNLQPVLVPTQVPGVRPAHQVPHVDGGVVAGAEQDPPGLGEAGRGE